jgi:hypothetical protein
MKQQVRQETHLHAGSREGMSYTDWADVDAWLGYEFWSSQVEAEMEPWAELEGAEDLLSSEDLAGCRKECESDVRPF